MPPHSRTIFVGIEIQIKIPLKITALEIKMLPLFDFYSLLHVHVCLTNSISSLTLFIDSIYYAIKFLHTYSEV